MKIVNEIYIKIVSCNYSPIIQPKFNKRPDLMAFELFGNARLWWVFAHYNRDKLKDPIMDFTSGTEIIAPNNFQVTGTL